MSTRSAAVPLGPPGHPRDAGPRLPRRRPRRRTRTPAHAGRRDPVRPATRSAACSSRSSSGPPATRPTHLPGPTGATAHQTRSRTSHYRKRIASLTSRSGTTAGVVSGGGLDVQWMGGFVRVGQLDDSRPAASGVPDPVAARWPDAFGRGSMKLQRVTCRKCSDQVRHHSAASHGIRQDDPSRPRDA